MFRHPRRDLFILFTLFGLLDTTYRYLDHAARDTHGDFLVVLIEQMTGHYGSLVILLPFAIALVRRAQPILFLPGILMASTLHTFWNWGTRVIVFFLCGLGPYDYGRMPIRFVMELPTDIIVLTVMSLICWQYNAWQQRDALEKSLAAARTELLTRQLQPHFLFNALNTISALMYEDVPRADRVLLRLSEFLRSTIDLRDRPLIPLSEELSLVQRYLDVIAARFEDKLSVSLDVDPAAHSSLVPPLLLQPLLENSVEHGRTPSTGQIQIHLHISRTNGRLLISLSDQGPGLANSTSGFGWEAVRHRLATAYPNHNATLTFDSPELPGARLHMDLPA